MENMNIETTNVTENTKTAEIVDAAKISTPDEVEVFESEYYDAKAAAQAGQSHAPSVLQTGEFGPLPMRNKLERSPGDEDIPVDELAVQEDFLPEHMVLIESARAAGAFTQGKGTIEVPETNGVVYAGIWETPKHNRIIRVLFRRANGEYTAPIEFDNALFTIAAQNAFALPDKSNHFYKDVVNFHKKAVMEIIDRLPLGSGINYEAVLEKLQKYHNQLPLHELVQDNASVETIYSEILRYVAAHGTERHNGTAYFRLDKQEIQQIADELEMSVKQMCAALKENELLYLTKSSVAYQTKVKFKGETANYYCVKKNFAQQATPKYAPTVLEDGTKVMHDGTVRTPLTLYQQLFGGAHPAALSEGSKSSNKKSVAMWDDDL